MLEKSITKCHCEKVILTNTKHYLSFPNNEYLLCCSAIESLELNVRPGWETNGTKLDHFKILPHPLSLFRIVFFFKLDSQAFTHCPHLFFLSTCLNTVEVREKY